MAFGGAFAHDVGEYNVELLMDLLWLLLEAGVALALLLWLVWWTWPRAKKKDEADRE
jgi:hypothetical protein